MNPARKAIFSAALVGTSLVGGALGASLLNGTANAATSTSAPASSGSTATAPAPPAPGTAPMPGSQSPLEGP